MDAVIHVREVKTVLTSTGKKRYVVTDESGREYTTFRPQVGERAAEFEGRRARIEYHEEQRGQFLNVYLDVIEDARAAPPAADGRVDEADEVAWNAAIEAAPWLVGNEEPREAVPAEEFFDRLKPFKELVSEDLHESAADDRREANKGG
jgi:hypothetical protein